MYDIVGYALVLIHACPSIQTELHSGNSWLMEHYWKNVCVNSLRFMWLHVHDCTCNRECYAYAKNMCQAYP